MNIFYNPVRTVQGIGCLNQLPKLVEEAAPFTQQILLLVWDESLLQQKEFQSLLHGENGNRILVRSLSCSNPELEQLYMMYEQTKNLNIGCVIAVGGGSVLDVGKSLCCLYGKELASAEDLRTLIAEKRYEKSACRWIGIPTTAGTGSEVTCWATIWDSANSVKYSIETQENYAYAAVVDPQLTQTMPIELAVSSALDAVAHAAESYWAKATNITSRGLALTAIRTIMEQLDALLERPEDINVRDSIAQGSMLAGLAFSNTHTTACHSISYPLTMRYHIPHGVAVSLLLGPIMELNASKVQDLDALLKAFEIERPTQLRERIESVLVLAGYHIRLQEWGSTVEDIPYLVSHSIATGRADNNPAELTDPVVRDILTSIF